MVQRRDAPAGAPGCYDLGFPARRVFLSGTPGGIVYQKPSVRQMFLGVSEMVFTLQWLNPQSVVEPFVREEYRSGRYLKADDQVQMRADRLGSMSNAISADRLTPVVPPSTIRQ